MHYQIIIGLVAYFIGMAVVGVWFWRRETSLNNYFLANRNIPWLAIMFSIVAAETSTLTLVSVPGLAYDTNFGFLQLVFGYIVARVIISLIFIPQYFRGEMFTAYELIQRRFGTKLRLITAGLFLMTRAAAEGVRVYAIAIVLGMTLGLNDVTSLAIIILLTLFYTYKKGLPAVIWTDVAQVGIYFVGALVAIFSLHHVIPGGWGAIYTEAMASHKFQIFDFSFSFFKTYTFWSGLIGGTFLTLASHGTDQLIVQRLLAAKNLRVSQLALIVSGFTVFIQFTLFLVIGVMLWVFYSKFPPAVAFARSDQIFPAFIHDYLSHGVSIFLIIAILAAAMANLSASLNSLSSSLAFDFYLRFRPRATSVEKIKFARLATIFWAAILFGLALISREGGRVLELGLAIASVVYGGMLGVFLLGTFSPRANAKGTTIGLFFGLMTNIFLWRCTHVSFTWFTFFGSMMTICVGYVASLMIATYQNSLVTEAS